ncbi:GntR family transcriptional regulator [Candidatus Poriferisocius sp.]|uniref:GntR family transcriptional regulator n=1 Tax=Candidatus Poriferisocius sp. TaxID=3101276 RepID=UPI003B012A4C
MKEEVGAVAPWRLKRATLVDSAYDAIRAQILDHSFGPNEKLGIDALADSFGVSQTPVREALSRLAAEGLAVYVSLAGYRVTPILDAKGFDRLMEARYALEPQLAALAAERVDSAEIDGLRELAVLAAGWERGGDYDRYRHHTDWDRRFHTAIATAADNPFMAESLAALRPHLHIYRLHHPSTGIVDTSDEHVAIVEAIAEADSAAAAKAMRAHLDSSYHRHAFGLTT